MRKNVFLFTSLLITFVSGLEANKSFERKTLECEGVFEDRVLQLEIWDKSYGLLAISQQKNGKYPQGTESLRHVAGEITHEYWKYSNGYDFELMTFPGGKGDFSGNLMGVKYQNFPLSCQFVRK